MKLKNLLAKNYINFIGWSSKRRLVLIESDDWGSVRVKNEEVFNSASKKFPHITNHKFLQYDGLERKVDLEFLFELLSQYKDHKGNSPVITALALTRNPDFEEISKSKSYQTESIIETYKKYGEDDLMDLWMKDGINNNLLYPQFHGREHLFPERYLHRIEDRDDTEYFAFQNHSVFGVDNTTRKKNFLAAFEFQSEADKNVIEMRTSEGLKEFEEIFGFQSKSFCPSQSIYGNHIFEVLKDNGVLAIQAGQQYNPINGQLKKIDHSWGEKTYNGLVFWRRNCTFEPYKNDTANHVEECLKEIEIAFRWGNPAVINSHRINFTSRIQTDLRDRAFRDLDGLLKSILKRWPDAEFVNSQELAEIIVDKN